MGKVGAAEKNIPDEKTKGSEIVNVLKNLRNYQVANVWLNGIKKRVVKMISERKNGYAGVG